MAKGYLIIVTMMAILAVIVGGTLSSEQPAGLAVAQPTIVRDGSADDGSSQAQRFSEGAVEIERSADGHFYADVEINGATIRALIDTGASAIALSREDALSAAVPTSIGMPNVIGRGADGDVYGEQVTLDRVALGHQTAENMPAIVLNSGQQTLLGQSFLSKFGSVEIRGDKMVLR